MQGRMIVFEGGEGGGKTTQLQRSHQWLLTSGWLELLQTKELVRQLVITREPGGTELGQGLRQLLLGQPGQEPIQDRAELLLYAADRAQHVDGFLRPHLAEGDLILCDRYTDSTIAYQGYGRGLDRRLIDQLNQIATQGLQSDLTLWLDVDVDTGLSRTQRRGTADRIEQADRAFHQRVQQGFADLARQHPQRIVRIDASQPEDIVSQQIQMTLNDAFARWYGITRL
jgi:dTMP kinase